MGSLKSFRLRMTPIWVEAGGHSDRLERSIAGEGEEVRRAKRPVGVQQDSEPGWTVNLLLDRLECEVGAEEHRCDIGRAVHRIRHRIRSR